MLLCIPSNCTPISARGLPARRVMSADCSCGSGILFGALQGLRDRVHILDWISTQGKLIFGRRLSGRGPAGEDLAPALRPASEKRAHGREARSDYAEVGLRTVVVYDISVRVWVRIQPNFIKVTAHQAQQSVGILAPRCAS